MTDLNRGKTMLPMHRIQSVILFLAAGISLTSCSNDFRQIPAGSPFPAVTPESVFTGNFTGVSLIKDRSGGIRGSAEIHRECTKEEGSLSGSCTDTVSYNGGSGQTKQISWRVRFRNDTEALWQVQEKDSEGRELDTSEGINATAKAFIVLSGKGRIPFSESVVMSTETRYALLPGQGNYLHQQKDYYFFGIRMGSVETFWRR